MNLFTKYFLPENETKNNLLIIHGLGEHSGRYLKLIKLLNENGVKVFTFDLPGHGKSKGLRGDISSLEELFKYIENYIPDNYILFGHSLGGLLATRFCQFTEKKPEKLILSDPAIGNIAKNKVLLAFLKIFKKMQISNRIKLEDLSTNPNAIEKYKNDILVHDKITIRTVLMMFNEAEKALERIEELKLPTLLLYGKEDKIINVSEYDKIIQDNITKVSFEKGKHELFECIYNEKAFYNKIIEFVNL